MAVAGQKGLLGCLDAGMDVGRPGRCHGAGWQQIEQAVQLAQDLQRYQPLGGRRHVIDAAARVRQYQRRLPYRAVSGEVLQAERTTDGGQVLRNAARQIAPVEIVEPRFRQLLQRGSQAWLAKACTGKRRHAARQEGFGKPGYSRELMGPRCNAGRLAMRDRNAVAGIADGVGKQPRQRHAPAQRLARPGARGMPAGHRPGDRVGRHPAAERDRCEARFTVALDAGSLCRRTARFEAAGRLIRPRDQPEAVAADAVHMRVGNRDRGRGRDHRFDGVSAFAQDRQRTLRSQGVRRDRHAAAAADGVPMKCHNVLRKLCIHKIHGTQRKACATPCPATSAGQAMPRRSRRC